MGLVLLHEAKLFVVKVNAPVEGRWSVAGLRAGGRAGGGCAHYGELDVEGGHLLDDGLPVLNLDGVVAVGEEDDLPRPRFLAVEVLVLGVDADYERVDR